jgi:hypothetical protein
VGFYALGLLHQQVQQLSGTGSSFAQIDMSSQKKTGKATPKSAKAEKASFEKVIIALEKENEAFVIPKGQSESIPQDTHARFAPDCSQHDYCYTVRDDVPYRQRIGRRVSRSSVLGRRVCYQQQVECGLRGLRAREPAVVFGLRGGLRCATEP